MYEVLGKKRLDLPKADGLEQVYTNKDPDQRIRGLSALRHIHPALRGGNVEPLNDRSRPSRKTGYLLIQPSQIFGQFLRADCEYDEISEREREAGLRLD